MTSITDEFPHEPGLLYLNHAGVGPWPRRTVEAIEVFARENLVRGAERYPQWIATEARLRARLSRLLDAAGTDDIALVKNTSEGLSFIAYGLDWQRGDNVVINRLEFPSNRIVWESLRARFGVEIRDVDPRDYRQPEDALLEAMDERTRLLPVSAVQYGTGVRMDLHRLGDACRANNTLFCVDAIQELGARAFSAHAIGADFVVADGHKWLLGPEGLGVLYATPQARSALRLTQFGWHMVEAMGDYSRLDWTPADSGRRFEAGSPNSLAIHALDASLSLFEEVGMAEVERRLLEVTGRLQQRIDAEPALELITPRADARRAGIVTFRVPRAEPDALLGALREHRVPCAARGGGIRFSPHFYQSPELVDEAIDRVLTLVG